MKTVPTIVMQLVHIEGPLKGQIQEFSQNEITIGRHPSCDSQMPKELNYISRKHAQIIREGNRFKIKDLSTNGTFVNGEAVKEAYVKDGDIVVIAMGGPKFSFLTREGEIEAAPPPPPEKKEAPLPEARIVQKLEKVPAKEFTSEPEVPKSITPIEPPPKNRPVVSTPPPPPPPPISAPPPVSNVSAHSQKIKVPFSIQFGAKIQSYKELPITIGKQASCHLLLEQENIYDQHALIFFQNGGYWIKDLTGRGSVRIDGRVIETDAELTANGTLSLSEKGPTFKIIGGGRLAEMAEVISKEETPPSQSDDEDPFEGNRFSDMNEKHQTKAFARDILKKLNPFQRKKPKEM